MTLKINKVKKKYGDKLNFLNEVYPDKTNKSCFNCNFIFCTQKNDKMTLI